MIRHRGKTLELRTMFETLLDQIMCVVVCYYHCMKVSFGREGVMLRNSKRRLKNILSIEVYIQASTFKR